MDKQHVFTRRLDTFKHESVLALAGVFMTLILFIITCFAFIISWPLWYMEPPLNFNLRNVWLFLPGPVRGRPSWFSLSDGLTPGRLMNGPHKLLMLFLRCNFYSFSFQRESHFLLTLIFIFYFFCTSNSVVCLRSTALKCTNHMCCYERELTYDGIVRQVFVFFSFIQCLQNFHLKLNEFIITF